MLIINDLCFAYPHKTDLFSGLSLSFDITKRYIICGENGSGKSTLLKLCAGLISPRSDSISFEGKPLTIKSIAKQILYLPQNPLDGLLGLHLSDDLAIWQMIASDSFKPEDVEILLRENPELASKPFVQMSSGQQRKASHLILPYMHSRFWLLDEPFAGLDEAGAVKLLELLQGKTDTGFVLVSHDRSLAEILNASMVELCTL